MQNTSSAVMNQRTEPDDSLDYFPTPPWATRALCEFLKHTFRLSTSTVWEPACGEGHMARPLSEYFEWVYATDVFDYSATFQDQQSVDDFLMPRTEAIAEEAVDWIITNPPFRLGEEFISTSMQRARIGCAMLVRTSFLEGIGRYNRLFSRNWPVFILQFCERVPMVKGRLDKECSTATSYCWIVWVNRSERSKRPKIANTAPQFNWIPACRSKLEKLNDYPKVKTPIAAAPLFDTMGGGVCEI